MSKILLKRLLIAAVMVATMFGLVASVGVAAAQPDTIAQTKPIKYGDVVRGSITNKTYQLSYKFTGQKDDAVVISLLADFGADKSLFSRLFSLKQGSKTLIDVKDDVRRAFIQLPADGDYTLTVTRTDGKTGTEEGAFILRVLNPQALEDGTPVDAQISQEQVTKDTSIDDYYLLPADNPFTVTYQITDGDERPSIDIDQVNDDKSLSSVAGLYGSVLNNGVLGVTPTSGAVYLLHVNDLYTKQSLSYTVTYATTK